MKPGRFVAASLLVLTLAGNAAGQGDENAAAAAFDDGASAYAANDFPGAAAAFERAFRLLPRGITAYNAGLAWQSAGEKARAADAYALALAQGDMPRSNDSDARTRLAELEAVLAQIYVRSPVGSRVFVAHVQGATVPTRVHLPPGDHEVRVQRANGQGAQRRVALVAGQSLDLDFGADAVILAPRPTASAAPSAGAAAGARTERGESDARPAIGWTLVGASAAAAGVAIVLGVSALEARDEYITAHVNADRSVDDTPQAHSDYDDVERLRLWTNVTWVGAGVLGAAGVAVLIWSAMSADTPPSRRGGSARLVPSGRGLSLVF